MLFGLLVWAAACTSSNAAEDFYPKGPWLVSLGEVYVCQHGNGTKSEFSAKTIQAIKIITNDRGPFEEDVFWKFEFASGILLSAVVDRQEEQAARAFSEIERLR